MARLLNSVVWRRPIATVQPSGGGRSDRRVARRTTKRHAAPAAVMMAMKVNGLA